MILMMMMMMMMMIMMMREEEEEELRWNNEMAMHMRKGAHLKCSICPYPAIQGTAIILRLAGSSSFITSFLSPLLHELKW